MKFHIHFEIMVEREAKYIYQLNKSSLSTPDQTAWLGMGRVIFTKPVVFLSGKKKSEVYLYTIYPKFFFLANESITHSQKKMLGSKWRNIKIKESEGNGIDVSHLGWDIVSWTMAKNLVESLWLLVRRTPNMVSKSRWKIQTQVFMPMICPRCLL